MGEKKYAFFISDPRGGFDELANVCKGIERIVKDVRLNPEDGVIVTIGNHIQSPFDIHKMVTGQTDAVFESAKRYSADISSHPFAVIGAKGMEVDEARLKTSKSVEELAKDNQFAPIVENIRRQYETFTSVMMQAGLPFTSVLGPRDVSEIMESQIKGKGQILNGNCVEVNGLRLLGYGGARQSEQEAVLSSLSMGLPIGKLTHYDRRRMIDAVKSAGKVDIFAHYNPPSGFADVVHQLARDPKTGQTVPVGIPVGCETLDTAILISDPALSICGRVIESTASKFEDKTVYIKCHGLGFKREGRHVLPIYYVEFEKGEDERYHVTANIDIYFERNNSSGSELLIGSARYKPVLSCRERYQYGNNGVTAHYRDAPQGNEVITVCNTGEGFRLIHSEPHNGDPVRWAFGNVITLLSAGYAPKAQPKGPTSGQGLIIP